MQRQIDQDFRLFVHPVVDVETRLASPRVTSTFRSEPIGGLLDDI